MGGFPQDEAKAFGVISWGSATAALSKATKVIVKTPHEAAGVPTMEANAQGLRCTKQVIHMLSDQVCTAANLEEEKEMIRMETRCIVDKCFELGEGDIADGTVKAVMCGVPFTDEIKAYHRAKIEERAKAEKRNASFQMVIDDVYAISKGRLVGRPRN